MRQLAPILLLFMIGTTAAAAEPPPPTTVEAVTVIGTPPPPEDPVICRQTAETGSRIPGRKICHKKSEWAAMSKPQNRAVNEVKVEGCPSCEQQEYPLPPSN